MSKHSLENIARTSILILEGFNSSIDPGDLYSRLDRFMIDLGADGDLEIIGSYGTVILRISALEHNEARSIAHDFRIAGYFDKVAVTIVHLGRFPTSEKHVDRFSITV